MIGGNKALDYYYGWKKIDFYRNISYLSRLSELKIRNDGVFHSYFEDYYKFETFNEEIVVTPITQWRKSKLTMTQSEYLGDIRIAVEELTTMLNFFHTGEIEEFPFRLGALKITC